MRGEESDTGLGKMFSKSTYTVNVECMVLFTVVYHHGKKATGGHYTTAVFHPAINNWIMIDDSLVKHVSVGSVLKNVPGRVPYLLYYRRIDMHWEHYYHGNKTDQITTKSIALKRDLGDFLKFCSIFFPIWERTDC